MTRDQPIHAIIEKYISRFQVRPPYFNDDASRLCMVVVIPSFKEPHLIETLNSLNNCMPPKGLVEIIIVLNAPEDASDEVLELHKNTIYDLEQWRITGAHFIRIKIIQENALPKKLAGAGLARKIGMDEALYRWGLAGVDGPIVCLDADCQVAPNYMVEIEHAFRDQGLRGAHCHFEHEFEKEANPVLQRGILHYELHLRCHIQGLRLAGYPFAMHTVGSCMIVRASTYAKAGGMNTRKAGEDFYFLHKIMPQGSWRSLSAATVFPSCRASDRVPFGTGKAQMDWLDSHRRDTYHVQIYQELSVLFKQVNDGYEKDIQRDHLSESLCTFLEQMAFQSRLNEMRKHAASRDTFLKRLWQHLDGFWVLKAVHYLRDHGLPDQPILLVAQELLLALGEEPKDEIKGLLMQFRCLDKNVSS